MTSIQSSTATSTATQLADIGLSEASDKEVEKSDKNQFLELMIAQLENQNPLDPQEGGEFLAQLAQFSMVDGVERLNENVATLQTSFRTSQALEAASLVGRKVGVATESFYTDGSGTTGNVVVPETTSNITLQIINGSGEIVREMQLGESKSGNKAFVWDGMNDAGDKVTGGTYRVNAFAKTHEGEEQLATEVVMNVDSVTIADTGSAELNIANFGSLPLDTVRQIR